MLNISELYVKKSVSLKTALSKLDQTALGVLFLVDEEDRFLRTVTDGDVRRLLLKKCTLDSYLHELPEHTSVTLLASEPIQTI